MDSAPSMSSFADELSAGSVNLRSGRPEERFPIYQAPLKRAPAVFIPDLARWSAVMTREKDVATAPA